MSSLSYSQPLSRSRIRWFLIAKLAPLVVVIMCRSAFAQVTSTIQGRITDPSGAIIAGGSVKATNEATGVSRTGQTATDGYYRIPDLLPGKYEVRIEHPGFKTLVRKGIDLNSQTVLNLDLGLEVGETTQKLEVTAEVPQIETTESRISEVVNTEQIRSLPAIGRGLMWLAMTTPGVQGKAEDGRSGLCCDSLTSLASPSLSSGGSELKAAFFVDGVALHYGDAMSWNLAFTPNLDAVEEMRVSTNPTSAEDGILSGVQVQMVTKGGSNTLHGTGQYTFLEDSFNALPYGASKSDVGSWHQRFFGGTIGGPIVKDRLFFFGAYEGLREKRAAPGGQAVIVETEDFKNWVTNTRPNSVAAQLLASDPPFRYATDNLVDVNGDGIMDLGTVAMDRPTTRTGNQFNGRIDYQTKSAKDRFYGMFWRSIPDQEVLDVRPTMDYAQKTGSNLWSIVNAHSFSPASLNEVRFATWDLAWDWQFKKNRYNVPCVLTDDGLGFPSTFSGSCSYSYEVFASRTYDIHDTFSWTRGAHSWKFGGNYRQVYMTDPTYLYGDTPVYNFGTAIDFANDNAYQETRNVDASTGKLRDPFVEAKNQQLSFFAQDSWHVRPGLTLNLGLRWDYYYAHPIAGIQQPRNTYGPLFTSDQVTPQGILGVRNQKLERSFNPDKNNFDPRISIAWDPRGRGRTVIRGGFFVLHDEINSLGLYRNYYGNPPISSFLSAGSEFGIPIVYGIAPDGTRDFPINPGLVGGATVDPDLGIFAGTRPDLTGYVRNWSQPMVYDANVAFQHQLFNDLAVTAAYHYRRSTNDLLSFNSNRFTGDLVDGHLDRLNPYYGAINTNVNWGRRIYHGLVFEASKRFSQGWQLNASYSYHNAHSNYGGTTEAFKPELDWARDEPSTHNVKMNALWELPFLRGRRDVLSTALGGWQLGTIWNFESGPYFNPTTGAPYGGGGDFNADGKRGDRPDRPTTDVSRTYSQADWMRGAINASVFPLPDTVRNGTLSRNSFNRPGYARIDASLAKRFPIKERATIQFQVQASNLLNKVNISGASSSLTSTSFGRATGFYPMRAVQMSLKVIF